MNKRQRKNYIGIGARLAILLFALSSSLLAQGKNPIILIPGLSGSELRNKTTNERIWFKAVKSKSEDLRLPILADVTKMHDDLIASDILREVKIGIFPGIDVYGGFIKAMETRGGYHEEKWESPSENGFEDSLYVFSYDWRLDNVENARLLVSRVEGLKRKFNKPDLKFDIVAHSMGGLISRYAAMYGDADLPAGNRKPQPTWAGARDFDKIVLLGTPNEGSALSLSSLLNGYAVGNLRIDLPFVQDSSKFMVFTIPAAYQLLPAPNTLRAYDDRLQPVSIDLYDPKVWTKYGWNVIDDKKFNSKFSSEEQKTATAYFEAALDRAKRLHEALAAAPGKSGGIDFYLVGADCGTAPDSVVVVRDGNSDKWKTLFSPKAFTRSDGSKVTAEELKKVLIGPGDGIVTRRSFEASTESEKAGVRSIVGSTSDKFICEEHNKLAANAKVQDYIIGILNGKGTSAKDSTEK
ncbi:MAG: hypothetical protein ABJB40_05520 [Acidobacteriota bacterium]